MTLDAEDKLDTVPRSLRTLLILEEVARVGVPMTPTEINRSIGLPKQTLHRMFSVLEEEGFLQREFDGRAFSPGPRLRAMSIGIMSSARARASRLAVMNALSSKIGETINLVVPDRLYMIYLDRVETNWPLRIQLPIGTQVPFHCTASGKLYLSTLPSYRLMPIINAGGFKKMAKRTITAPKKLAAEISRIREVGFSQDNEEFIDGMVAIATPVRDVNGRMVASLALHAPTPRMSIDEALTHIQDLRAAADELTSILAEEQKRTS